MQETDQIIARNELKEGKEGTFKGLSERLSDGGPRYAETPPKDYPFAQSIVEPWNATTAFLFVGIAIYWGIRIWPKKRSYPILITCLPLLLVGGIGGTIYHATRSSRVFFLLDVVPIQMIGILVSIFLWIRLGPTWRTLFSMVGLVALLMSLRLFPMPLQWSINIAYASLAVLILFPLLYTLKRTHFQYGQWILFSFVCFILAWIFRILDVLDSPVLPMGTHWLWHIFGALCTSGLGSYFYRLEVSPLFLRENLRNVSANTVVLAENKER